MPGRTNSRPWRPAAQLANWRAIIVRELQGKQIARLMLDPRVLRVGADADGDRVPDVLEDFVGSAPAAATRHHWSLPAALAVYRQLLLDAGVTMR